MIIEHLILATNSSVDKDRNTLSIFDVVEDIQLVKPKDQQVNFPVQIIAVIKRDNNDIGEIRSTFLLTLDGPKKKDLLGPIKLPVNLSSEHKRQRLRVNIMCPVNESGEYHFTLQKEDEIKIKKTISSTFKLVAVQN